MIHIPSEKTLGQITCEELSENFLELRNVILGVADFQDSMFSVKVGSSTATISHNNTIEFASGMALGVSIGSKVVTYGLTPPLSSVENKYLQYNIASSDTEWVTASDIVTNSYQISVSDNTTTNPVLTGSTIGVIGNGVLKSVLNSNSFSLSIDASTSSDTSYLGVESNVAVFKELPVYNITNGTDSIQLGSSTTIEAKTIGGSDLIEVDLSNGKIEIDFAVRPVLGTTQKKLLVFDDVDDSFTWQNSDDITYQQWILKTSSGSPSTMVDGSELELLGSNGIITSNTGSVVNIALNASISNLSDVASVSPSVGQILSWNGTAYVNEDIPVDTTLLSDNLGNSAIITNNLLVVGNGLITAEVSAGTLEVGLNPMPITGQSGNFVLTWDDDVDEFSWENIESLVNNLVVSGYSYKISNGTFESTIASNDTVTFIGEDFLTVALDAATNQVKYGLTNSPTINANKQVLIYDTAGNYNWETYDSSNSKILVNSINSNYQVLDTDEMILVKTLNNLTVTLPLSPQNGDKYVIKQEVSGTVIDGNGKNIDGLVTYTLPIPYQSATLVYMTNDWYVI
jgi:hypothetical protein